ncbi:iron chelate uptake ABC transporter family permease subunit [Sodalis ligni]|nr:iron chelate uptake ABC transporter family permease subunit [Sodalis ligni]
MRPIPRYPDAHKRFDRAAVGGRQRRTRLRFSPLRLYSRGQRWPIGAALMLAADWCDRMVMFPNQIPAGLLATFIGAPYFVFLRRRQDKTAV